MIIADGCDLIEIERIAKALQRENFCTRIYTAAELSYAESKKNQRKAASLAAVFAAKEAVAKALGVGLGQIGWREIEAVSYTHLDVYKRQTDNFDMIRRRQTSRINQNRVADAADFAG